MAARPLLPAANGLPFIRSLKVPRSSLVKKMRGWSLGTFRAAAAAWAAAAGLGLLGSCPARAKAARVLRRTQLVSFGPIMVVEPFAAVVQFFSFSLSSCFCDGFLMVIVRNS